MPTYAIGDIQGCYAELSRLLDKLSFDPSGDRLWLVGDLVNRGPDSLAVLRFVRSLGAAATVVLGNHDLYLLMLAAGFRKRGKDDTLEPVLKAPDREELLDWLALRKLFHAEGRFAMVHADSFPNGASHRRSCSPLRSSRPCVGPGGRRFSRTFKATSPTSGATICAGRSACG